MLDCLSVWSVFVVFGVGVVAGHLEDLVGDEVLAGAVALDDGRHHVLGHVLIVGEELLGVLRKAVATIAKRRVVVMGADAGVETDTIDDGLGVEPLHLSISVELVEVTDAQGKVGVGKEFDGLSLFHSYEEGRHIFLDGGLLQQASEDVSFLGEPVDVGQGFDGLVLLLVFFASHHLGHAHDDTARVEVVIECLALAQELRREEEIEFLHAFLLVFDIEAAGISHGDGTLDDHDGVGVNLEHSIDDGLYCGGVEEVLLAVIVSRSSYDHELGIAVAGFLIKGGLERQRLVGQIVLNIVVLDGRLLVVH